MTRSTVAPFAALTFIPATWGGLMAVPSSTAWSHPMTAANAQTTTMDNSTMITETATASISQPSQRLLNVTFDYQPTTVAIKAMTPEKAQERLATARIDYLDKRERLRQASDELTRLEKTVTAAETQEQQAAKSWRKAFLEGAGQQGKEVRYQQKQAGQWRIEAEQKREMIELLTPQVEWFKIQTQVAQEEFQRRLSAAQEVITHHTLLAEAEKLFEGLESDAFRASLKGLFQRITDDLCNNVGYMTRYNLDVSSEPGERIFTSLNDQEAREVRCDIRQRQYAALGELMWHLLPKTETQQPATLKGIAPLACEANPNELGTTLARHRRLVELEATMEYVPGKTKH
ncbi:hypothetical protein [Larsenimonas rhizosphaerae]|uniref:Uncharacterized protein n=1 Tax=Larsenimonas rhizosphaerae TaxID=2944682 RepID=A0AA42CXY5_9GAMM|nr:hypothetical protein [Larsenimonas rhizosphaerae]MCX2524438.1 hypothetical protein [Larsenimonas rhizosphaerae]